MQQSKRKHPSEAALNLSPIVTKLEKAQSAFFRAADQIPAEKWSERPGPEQWSAAEVVAHLIGIERLVLQAADAVLRKSPRSVPLWKRVHLPIWFAEVRMVRLKSPVPFESRLLARKEDMLGALRETRERAVAFLQDTRKRDLRVYRWRHPFLGSLNFYEWFKLIAAHQIRHSSQMNDIGKQLPKVVESSQIR